MWVSSFHSNSLKVLSFLQHICFSTWMSDGGNHESSNRFSNLFHFFLHVCFVLLWYRLYFPVVLWYILKCAAVTFLVFSLLRNILAIWNLLWLHTNFKMLFFSISVNNSMFFLNFIALNVKLSLQRLFLSSVIPIYSLWCYYKGESVWFFPWVVCCCCSEKLLIFVHWFL